MPASGSPRRADLFVFQPDDGPAFELWGPRGMRQVSAPESVGALIAESDGGFAPNLVVVHDRVGPDVTLPALIARLHAGAATLPGAEVEAERTVAGTSGEVRILAFTHDGLPESGPLYQVTACLLAPAAEADEEEPGSERDLISLTGTCTVEQMERWDRVFVDAASSVRFG